MTGFVASFTRTRRQRAALVAMVPAIAFGAVGVGATCLCPDHGGAVAQAGTPSAAIASVPATGHGTHDGNAGSARGDTAPSSRPARHAMTAAEHGMTPAEHAAMPTSSAPAETVAAEEADAEANPYFEVGTRSRPVMVGGSAARAWTASAGADTAMPSMGGADGVTTVAADAAVATRTVLTTAQATKQLSKKCQKLLKVKKTGRLSKADRKRRTKCIAQRRELVARDQQREASPETITGVTAPAPAVQGPAPAASPTTPGATPAPASPTAPGATPPSGSGPTAPTVPGAPIPTPAPGINPDDVMCSAVGLAATDAQPSLFQMSRSVACPAADGKIYFELVNRDRQMHNLGIQSAGKANTLKPAILAVEGGERASVAVTLAPGSYDIVCMVAGHGLMNVKLTVLTKADYIAKGFAG